MKRVHALFAGAPLVLAAVTLGSSSCGEEEPPEAPATVVFDMKVAVAPGAEVHLCQFVRMPDSDEEIFVSGGSYRSSNGSHHFLLFRTDPEMPEQPLNEPIDCYEGSGVMQYERGFVTGGQEPSQTGYFPVGMGLPFHSGEVLMMQAHVVNASGAEIEASVHVELERVAAAEVDTRIGTLRYYNPFIYVPANGSSQAVMRCPIRSNITLLSAGAHMHARGVSYRAFLDLPNDPPSDEPFYTTEEWQHPDYYVGVLDAPAGSALRFQCDYDNPSGDVFVQGRSAQTDEMCMLSGFYYPALSEDEELCVEMDMHGTGDRSCAQTTSCIQLCDPDEAPRFGPGQADVGACFQQCIVDSCPNVTGVLFPQLLCTADQCAVECETYGLTCSACVQDHCKEQLDACQAASCDD